MLTQEALDLIQTTAVEAAHEPLLAPLPGTEPWGVYFLKTPDGTYQRRTAEQRHRVQMLDIESLYSWVNNLSGDVDASVWYSSKAVVGIADTDRATFSLQLSAQFEKLIEWAKSSDGVLLDQPTVWRFFRTLFRDRISNYAGVMQAVKGVAFRQQTDTTSATDRTRVSMGKSIAAESVGPEVPELLTFVVPAYRNPSVQQDVVVTATFDADPQAGMFRLAIRPGDIEAAIQTAENALLRDILESIGEEAAGSLPVYHGTPE